MSTPPIQFTTSETHCPGDGAKIPVIASGAAMRTGQLRFAWCRVCEILCAEEWTRGRAWQQVAPLYWDRTTGGWKSFSWEDQDPSDEGQVEEALEVARDIPAPTHFLA